MSMLVHEEVIKQHSTQHYQDLRAQLYATPPLRARLASNICFVSVVLKPFNGGGKWLFKSTEIFIPLVKL